MNIIISNSSGKPIYEQIAAQIKAQIIALSMPEGESLPSIRALAKDLHISVITTKRAYEDLERDGFIETIPGKGSFVAPRNHEIIREEQLKRAEHFLQQAIDTARIGGISKDELIRLLTLLYEEEGL